MQTWSCKKLAAMGHAVRAVKGFSYDAQQDRMLTLQRTFLELKNKKEWSGEDGWFNDQGGLFKLGRCNY